MFHFVYICYTQRLQECTWMEGSSGDVRQDICLVGAKDLKRSW